MKITRLYTGEDGESHFEDIEVPLEDRGGWGRQSELIKATGIIFRENGEHKTDWHSAPRRQFVIKLVGRIEVEIGDGTKRQFGPGDILLAEDTTGRGHRSRSLNHGRQKNLYIIVD